MNSKFKIRRIKTSVDNNTHEIVKRLCEAKGISLSEYIRSLIIADLDSRSIFSTELKRQLFGGDTS